MKDINDYHARSPEHIESLTKSGHTHLLDTFPYSGIQLHPPLNQTISTYDVVHYLPVDSVDWINSRTYLVKAKSILFDWIADRQFINWNIASTDIMIYNKINRSLDRSILDYQIDKWMDWSWQGEPPPAVDRIANETLGNYSGYGVSGEEVGNDPLRTAAFFTIWAARLLYYDMRWIDPSVSDYPESVRTEIDWCTGEANRARYLCEGYYGRSLVTNKQPRKRPLGMKE